jgi:hypothetical protein
MAATAVLVRVEVGEEDFLQEGREPSDPMIPVKIEP